VMRARPNMAVTLFDGSGAEFAARVERVGRAEVELAIVSRAAIDRELPFDLTLAVALPKGDRQKWLVEKAVELGVTRLVPLETARGVAQPVEQALVRLRRSVIEASKQCGRNRLMEIGQPRAWSELVTRPAEGAVRLVAHPAADEEARREKGEGGREEGEKAEGRYAAGQALLTLLAARPAPLPSPFPLLPSVLAAVGPEGGFTEEEVRAATDAGWQLVDLGPRILRVETAAIALAVAIAWGR
jgi:16S rRNA (uracil1498-N3)-methyltransferase